MPSDYPGQLDSFVNPTDTDTLDNPSHSALHTDANDAIEAVQGELGINPRGSHADVRARLDSIEQVGQLAYAEATVDQTGIDAFTDLTGLSVTLTPPAGRRIRITGWCKFLPSNAGSWARLFISDEGGTIKRSVTPQLTSTSTLVEQLAHPVCVFTSDGAQHTYKLNTDRAGGSGTVEAQAGAFILVEDLGPA